MPLEFDAIEAEEEFGVRTELYGIRCNCKIMP